VVENRRSTDAENERKQCIVLLGRRGLWKVERRRIVWNGNGLTWVMASCVCSVFVHKTTPKITIHFFLDKGHVTRAMFVLASYVT
jgi:hypothetical protein